MNILSHLVSIHHHPPNNWLADSLEPFRAIFHLSHTPPQSALLNQSIQSLTQIAFHQVIPLTYFLTFTSICDKPQFEILSLSPQDSNHEYEKSL